jgi:hypothetical protein
VGQQRRRLPAGAGCMVAHVHTTGPASRRQATKLSESAGCLLGTKDEDEGARISITEQPTISINSSPDFPSTFSSHEPRISINGSSPQNFQKQHKRTLCDL